MSVMLIFLHLIGYAVAGMILCLWVDGVAEVATEKYIGSSALRSTLVWLTWPISLPLLLYVSGRMRRNLDELLDATPRRPLSASH